MLAEMIKAIVGLADARREFKSYKEPDGRHEIVLKPDGTSERLLIPNYRFYHVDNLASLSALLGNSDGGDKRKPVVFVSSVDGVVLVECYYSETDRTDRIRLHVNTSSPFNTLLALTGWSKQKEVVNALRDQLYGNAEAGLLAKLRAIDFTRRNDGTRTIEHGEIPERTVFRMPMFLSRDFSELVRSIECTIDLDAANESIRFVPLKDQLNEAIEFGNEYVADIIRESLQVDGIDGAIVVLGSVT